MSTRTMLKVNRAIMPARNPYATTIFQVMPAVRKSAGSASI